VINGLWCGRYRSIPSTRCRYRSHSRCYELTLWRLFREPAAGKILSRHYRHL